MSSNFVLLLLATFVSKPFSKCVAILQPFVLFVLSKLNIVAISFAVLGYSFILQAKYIDAAIIPFLLHPLNVLN